MIQSFHVADPTGRIHAVTVDGRGRLNVLGDSSLPDGIYQLHALDDELVEHGRFSVGSGHPSLVIRTTPDSRRTEPDSLAPLAGNAFAYRNFLHKLWYRKNILEGRHCHLCNQLHSSAELSANTVEKWRLDFQERLAFEETRLSSRILQELLKESTTPASLGYFQFKDRDQVLETWRSLDRLICWQRTQPTVEKSPAPPVATLFGTAPATQPQP